MVPLSKDEGQLGGGNTSGVKVVGGTGLKTGLRSSVVCLRTRLRIASGRIYVDGGFESSLERVA